MIAQSYRIRCLLLAFGMTLTSCGKGPEGPKDSVSDGPVAVIATDTNTNWLMQCNEDLNCGAPFACMCGHCTVPCSEDVDCVKMPEPAVCRSTAGNCEVPVRSCELPPEGATPAVPNVCPDASIIVDTQLALDQLSQRGCTVIEGSVTVQGEGIVSLQGLEALQAVNGVLTIDQTSNLVDLQGLSGLKEGDLRLSNNTGLQSLDGLTAVLSARSVVVSHNPVLTRISLPSLQTCGALNIASNAQLSRIDFSALRSVESLSLTDNPMLSDLGSMGQLDSVAGLTVIDNPVLNTCLIDELETHGAACTCSNNAIRSGCQ